MCDFFFFGRKSIDEADLLFYFFFKFPSSFISKRRYIKKSLLLFFKIGFFFFSVKTNRKVWNYHRIFIVLKRVQFSGFIFLDFMGTNFFFICVLSWNLCWSPLIIWTFVINVVVTKLTFCTLRYITTTVAHPLTTETKFVSSIFLKNFYFDYQKRSVQDI